MNGVGAPIRLAVVNDYELVVVGVAALLEPYRDRIEVVEVDCGSGGLGALSDVDVVLYDTFGRSQDERLDIIELFGQGRAKVVVFSWHLEPDLWESSLRRGAAGYLSKALTAKELVAALEEVAAGVRVLPTPTAVTGVRADVRGETWLAPSERPERKGQAGHAARPGRPGRLTTRESEIVALITQGLSNQEIADRSYLSINSVKTYIRTAYRKMGVTRRSQAVLWGIRHGFEPDDVRYVRDPA